MIVHDLLILAAASAAAFALAVLSAVAGFGGGVLLLPVFSALFGLRVAVPTDASYCLSYGCCSEQSLWVECGHSSLGCTASA